jgi:hypothetical protein
VSLRENFPGLLKLRDDSDYESDHSDQSEVRVRLNLALMLNVVVNKRSVCRLL